MPGSPAARPASFVVNNPLDRTRPPRAQSYTGLEWQRFRKLTEARGEFPNGVASRATVALAQSTRVGGGGALPYLARVRSPSTHYKGTAPMGAVPGYPARCHVGPSARMTSRTALATSKARRQAGVTRTPCTRGCRTEWMRPNSPAFGFPVVPGPKPRHHVVPCTGIF